uniref:Uncharacterized protein n=1 Tax=Strombidinopsis acuminata TaxID=141414 RepID=A0A7S3RB64_9SPIT|mmetsp:Transcript_88315/g.227733  ORF Transcript_88315/g.227733 Transcript_88315/m.227733 type:complete len:125 (+) Transcript_88315:64-438(+)
MAIRRGSRVAVIVAFGLVALLTTPWSRGGAGYVGGAQPAPRRITRPAIADELAEPAEDNANSGCTGVCRVAARMEALRVEAELLADCLEAFEESPSDGGRWANLDAELLHAEQVFDAIEQGDYH